MIVELFYIFIALFNSLTHNKDTKICSLCRRNLFNDSKSFDSTCTYGSYIWFKFANNIYIHLKKPSIDWTMWYEAEKILTRQEHELLFVLVQCLYLNLQMYIRIHYVCISFAYPNNHRIRVNFTYNYLSILE